MLAIVFAVVLSYFASFSLFLVFYMSFVESRYFRSFLQIDQSPRYSKSYKDWDAKPNSYKISALLLGKDTKPLKLEKRVPVDDLVLNNFTKSDRENYGPKKDLQRKYLLEKEPVIYWNKGLSAVQKKAAFATSVRMATLSLLILVPSTHLQPSFNHVNRFIKEQSADVDKNNLQYGAKVHCTDGEVLCSTNVEKKESPGVEAIKEVERPKKYETGKKMEARQSRAPQDARFARQGIRSMVSAKYGDGRAIAKPRFSQKVKEYANPFLMDKGRLKLIRNCAKEDLARPGFFLDSPMKRQKCFELAGKFHVLDFK